MAANLEKEARETDKAENDGKGSTRIFIGIATALLLIILLIGVYIYRILAPKDAAVQEKPTIGIIRIKDAIKAHKDYGEIEKLKKEYEATVVEIMALSEPVEIKIPETDEELFKESARQKLSQTLVDKIAALDEKRRAAVEKYVKETEPAYEKKRAEIDERYLTAIADLRMKLDNSDILHLTDEKVNELADQLSALQHERGEAQDALKAEREQKIYNYGEQVIKEMSGEIAELDKEAEKLMSEASLKESEVMERNMRLLEESFGEDRILKIKEKEDALAQIKDELYAKEELIFADISSIAAKYAMQKELNLILADTAMSLKSLLPEELQRDKADGASKVTVLNGVDITDDIIQDLLIDEK